MNTVPWDQVRDVVDAVLALEPGQRADFLSEVCPEPAVKRYVESLLAAYDEGGDLLDQPAVFSPAKPLIESEDGSWVGRRVGSYQVVAEIGEGGMGAVYRAIRADDQYHQQVAIKVVRSGFPGSFTLGRFRAERQILASLEHPNIARLLDGGAEAGLPYLVMELVEGEPIDRYCDRHRLTVTERLRLFRTACGAVQYAHRRLVVHRDLKPGNILVTSEGVPKLLDFGIAKILDPGSFPQALDPTMSGMRMLTPEYASPEQVRGETITTASDVYSLGVVLYVLLTGRGPYRLKSHAPHELAQAICDTEPEKPSTAISRVEKGEGDADPRLESVSSRRREPLDKLRRQLAGELDNIVLMALRKEPERRYASVEQLSEDIRRHLEGLPVIAHQDTLGYRSGKFIQRNKLAVTAVLLVVLSLVVGLAATVHEARVARAQRARAERRFNDVRKLANSLIFEVHDSIQTLPGATPVRKLIVDRALQYLDSLATEAHGDVDLQRDLAWAYQRVGLAQGDLFAGNIGDPRGALASIRKASAIWEAIAKTKGATLDDQINNAYGHRVLSNMMSGAGEGDGMEPAREAVAISESLFQIAPTHARVRRELSRDYESLADHEEWLGNYANSLADLRKEYQLCKDALQAKPGDRELLRGFAAVSVKIGTDLAYLGFREQALSINRQGVEIYRSLAKDERDALMRRELAIVLGEQGWIMLMDGQPGVGAANLSPVLGDDSDPCRGRSAKRLVTK